MVQAVAHTDLSKAEEQPWLRSAVWDTAFISGPAFLSAAIALSFKNQMESMSELPLWAWVSFVLLIDVAHVYATLFRTYFNKAAWKEHSEVLRFIPLLCWAAGAILYSLHPLAFWRTLAYLAVFHFVRQQYGFLALYSRFDPPFSKQFKKLDEITIYLACICPLMFWHTNLPRQFHWFVEGDFFSSTPNILALFVYLLYGICLAAFVFKEIWLAKAKQYFNLPKNLILLSTAFSWWVAIVAIDSDMSFTMVNVVSHGIPYMALIWHYQRYTKNTDAKKQEHESQDELAPDTWISEPAKLVLRICLSYAPAFLVLLFCFAYLEEGLWDALVWREHAVLFAPIWRILPQLSEHSILALLLPLLSLPQSSHYVLDGFIWRIKSGKNSWSA